MDKFITRKKRKTDFHSSTSVMSCYMECEASTSSQTELPLLLNTCSVEQQPSKVFLHPESQNESGCAPQANVSLSQVDIGTIARKIFESPTPVKTSDQDKSHILKELFVPARSFKFPATQCHKKNLKFQYSWLERWEWLAYSKLSDGAFCKYCILFAPGCIGKGDYSVRNASLIGQPFRNWKDAINKFQEHSKKSYHISAVASADNFQKVVSGKIEDIATCLDNKRKKEKEQNRAALLPIIETVMFCGENELPLRGDNDSGPITPGIPKKKDGKFRALIRYRAKYDEVLKNHLLNSSRNATYVSPEIQNDIINTCGKLIQEKLVKDINSAECFSVIGDETLDVSGQQQFSLCIRYVKEEEFDLPVLREDFVTFFPLTDLCAENVSAKIIDTCNSLGIDLEKLVGQGYDGASTMSGCNTGVQTRILELHPKAMYVHCSSHCLNLVLSNSLNVPLIKNCLGVVKEVTQFFRHNTQAGNLLKENIINILPNSKRSRLLAICDTRFIERQASLNVFVELLPAVVKSLQELSVLGRTFSSTASTLLAAMERGSFTVALLVTEYVFSFTLKLSTYLQNPQHTLSSALKFSDEILRKLKDLRSEDKFECEFHKIFEKSSTAAKEVFESVIDVPRQVKKQTERDNHPHDSPEVYYRRAVFLPAIDGLIVNLEKRFHRNKDFLSSIEIVLPINCHQGNVGKLSQLKVYFENRVSQTELEAEYTLWCEKWRCQEKSLLPTRLMLVIDACDKNYYPNIRYLLCVLASLPVSTCEAERSFSTMKRVKNYLRNTMGNERLTGLALMSVHYPLPFTAEDVLNIMAREGKRRLVL